mmetsp:Transcript_26161/g.40011  ORF Transcript_26161/g.40011 Transcript_26161/m.40011 type:complete len:83 (+) Transcript_26161:1519-1767(+)
MFHTAGRKVLLLLKTFLVFYGFMIAFGSDDLPLSSIIMSWCTCTVMPPLNSILFYSSNISMKSLPGSNIVPIVMPECSGGIF